MRKFAWRAALGLALLLWARSYAASDSLIYWWGPARGDQQALHLHSGHGGLGFYRTAGTLLNAEPGGSHFWWKAGPRDSDTFLSVVLESFIPQWVDGISSGIPFHFRTRGLVVPYGWPILMLAGPSLLRSYRASKRRQRQPSPDLCVRCGGAMDPAQDLCPGCGAPSYFATRLA